MSIRVIVSGIAVSTLLAASAAAQPPPATSRIPTVTRLVKTFSELEARLNASLAARDLAAIDQTVDSDFEMRVGAAPGTPIPRAEWIRQSMDKPHHGSIDQMAVHDFGSVAVVSFRQSRSAASANSTREHLFVVDNWKRAGDGWKLATRYLSNAQAPESAAPGSPPIDKRY